MTPREGRCCELCGYPVAGSPGELCDRCEAWQPIAQSADDAIRYAKAESDAESSA